jgi:hypothetical protein
MKSWYRTVPTLSNPNFTSSKIYQTECEILLHKICTNEMKNRYWQVGRIFPSPLLSTDTSTVQLHSMHVHSSWKLQNKLEMMNQHFDKHLVSKYSR